MLPPIFNWMPTHGTWAQAPTPHNLQERTSHDKISRGDGKTIPITYTDSTKLNASSNVFRLFNSLVVPAGKQNLILFLDFAKITQLLLNSFFYIFM